MREPPRHTPSGLGYNLCWQVSRLADTEDVSSMRNAPSRFGQWMARAFWSRSRGRLRFGLDIWEVVKPVAFPLRLF